MTLEAFHFIRPWWLLALIPAIAVIILLLRNKLNQGNWSKVCDAELLPFLLQQKPDSQNHWILSAAAFSCLLVIFALAGPTWERLPSPVFRNDAALVIALDLSRSMDSTDIKPSRISRARFKIADILKQRKDGQTALLVYAGDAFIVTPLTEDSETIDSQLSALTTKIMPSQGSNTVAALEKAVELLKQAGLQSGEILLITDGVDYDATVEAVESLSGYQLSILGIGTEKGAPVTAPKGGFLKDAEGNIVIPKLNSQELSRLAKKGNGLYKVGSSDDSDIEALLNQMNNPLEKTGNLDNNLFIDQWDEKGPWLLLLVIPFAALSFRKGLIVALVCLLPFPETSYALEWNDLWKTSDQRAQQAFKQENYQQAAEQFDNPQWKAAAHYKSGDYQQTLESLENDQSASGHYNKANALAQSGKLQKAIEAYEEALELEPKNEDAQYNKKKVEKALEKQQQNQQQDKDKKDSEQEQSEEETSDQKNPDQGEGENKDQSENNKQEQKDKQDNADQDSENKQSDEQQSAENSETDKAEEAENEQSSEQNQEQETEEAESQQQAKASEYDESEQANEQFLNRIPDDPAGLLKRKFKYQYRQRNRKANNTQAW